MSITDLDIKNKYGSLWIEPRGKGVLIYVEFKDVEGMPPNHIALDEYETLQLAKWIVEWINVNTKLM